VAEARKEAPKEKKKTPEETAEIESVDVMNEFHIQASPPLQNGSRIQPSTRPNRQIR